MATSFNTDENGLYLPDPYSRIRRVRKVLDGKAYTYRYDYDVMGRITAVTYPGGRSVNYTYNNLGQLERVPGYIEEALTYNADGLLEGYVARNNVFRQLLYDRNNRLTALRYDTVQEELGIDEVELKLDYSAISLRVDLEGRYSVNRIEIDPLQTPPGENELYREGWNLLWISATSKPEVNR